MKVSGTATESGPSTNWEPADRAEPPTTSRLWMPEVFFVVVPQQLC